MPEDILFPEPSPIPDPASVNTGIPAVTAENGLTSAKDFEVEAFETLDTAEDYNTGVNKLIDYYSSHKFDDQNSARNTLSEYSNSLLYKFDAGDLDQEIVLAIAPIKPQEVEGETEVERISNWQKANIEALSTTADPDQIAIKDNLINKINYYASDARRGLLGDKKGWWTDKFYRFTRGAVGPFSELFGEGELNRDLLERTNRKEDTSISGMVASGLGAVGPFVAATVLGGPAAVALLGPAAASIGSAAAGLSVIGAQAGGSAEESYNASLEATGDTSRATTAAALTAGAQAVQLIPVGRAAAGLTKTVARVVGREAAEAVVTQTTSKSLKDALIAGLDAQKTTFGNVARSTIEAGTMGTAGHVIGNLANNIGLDENGDITEGAVNAFLSNAILGGVITGADAVLHNSIIEQAKRSFAEADKESTKSKPPTEGKTAVTEEPLFYKDNDGYLVPRDETDTTVESRAARQKEFAEEQSKYLNKKPIDTEGKVTNDIGEEVILPSSEDVDVDTIPNGTTILSNPSELTGWQQEVRSTTSGRMLQYLASKLGTGIELGRNVSNGAFGAFYTSLNKIRLLRSLGSNAKQFINTLAHELGHAVDGKLNEAFEKNPILKTVAEKLTGIKNLVKELPAASEFLNSEARRLSAEWRSGWDGTDGDANSTDLSQKFKAYRAKPVEVYADVLSALLVDPDRVPSKLNEQGGVRQRYPELYDAFEKSLARSEDLNTFWNWFQDLNQNPKKITEFDWQVSLEGKQRQGEINAKSINEKIESNTWDKKLMRDLKLSYETMFNRIRSARQAAMRLTGERRKAAMDLVSDIGRYGMLSEWLQKTIDRPLNKVLAKFHGLQKEGVEPIQWAIMEWANHVTKESTPTMGRVADNFELYKQAAQVIRDFLRTQKGVKPGLLEEVFNLDSINTPEELSRAFSQIGLIGDTAEVLNVEDFVSKYDPKDPERTAKAARDLKLVSEGLNKRRESIPVESLKKYIKGLSDDPKKVNSVSFELLTALQDVTQNSAFSIRRFLLNAGGYDINTAARDLAALREKLGPERYAKLEKISNEYHQVLAAPLELIRESGIFTPELLARMELNKGSWVTANILKFFTGDESISSTVRSAIGSLSETGNELNSSSLKIKAVGSVAFRQRSVNAAVRLAEQTGLVTEVTKGNYITDVYALRDRLSKSDKEHSYLIGKEEGVPSLYKIKDGKGWERMFTRYDGKDLGAISMVLDWSEQFNKALLTKALKTVFNPVYVLNQKFYDRKLEAIIANSLAPNFGLPTHLFGKVKPIDKASVANIKESIAKGELVGDAKTLVDLDGAAFNIASAYEGKALESDVSFENGIYELFGNKMPDERTMFERFGQYSQDKIENLKPFKFFKDMAEFDEFRTKLNGFKIGKELYGMSDKAAAKFARENFGIPDPMGGGVASPFINRMFLFGGAHYAGLRTLARIGRDMPKTAVTQTVVRILLPKLLVSNLVIGGMFRSFGREDDAKKFEILNGWIPTNDKISKGVMLFGAQDGQGNFHNFTEFDSKDIQPDWKPWYSRLPQSREVTAVTKVLWPLISNLIDGKPGEGARGAANAVRDQARSGLQPALQYMWNLGEIFFSDSGNPTDFYRQKPIFDKKLAESGSPFEKAKEFSQYVLSQQLPLGVPYNPFKTTKPQSFVERAITSYPVIGPFIRGYVGVSDYGKIEQGQKSDAVRTALEAKLVHSTGDATKELLQEYSRSHAQITNIRKGWEKKLGNEVSSRHHLLQSWHSKAWLNEKEEMKAALAAGDTERYQRHLEKLESLSKKILAQVHSKASSFQPAKDRN